MAHFVYNYSRQGKAAIGSPILDKFSHDDLLWQLRNLELLQWQAVDSSKVQGAMERMSFGELISTAETPLQIILAPIDRLGPSASSGLARALVQHYRIPTEYALESGLSLYSSVTNSFGTIEDGEECLFWAHSMVKTILLRFSDVGEPYIGVAKTGYLKSGDVFPQQDDTWAGAGFFLRWRPAKGKDRPGSIVMIVFTPHDALREAFRDLLPQPAWQETLADPLSLFVPVLEYLYLEIARAINAVMTVLKHVEKHVLKRASNQTNSLDFDFVGMNKISTHITHIRESCTSTLATVDRVRTHHESLLRSSTIPTSSSTRNTHQLLLHKQTLLQACATRVSSMESRMQNMANLAFNTVNQRDSRDMRADSQAMKVIAMMTMLFLPVTAVATVCGSNFVTYDQSTGRVGLAVNFGLFWAVTLPLTLIVFVAYGVSYAKWRGRVDKWRRNVGGAAKRK